MGLGKCWKRHSHKKWVHFLISAKESWEIVYKGKLCDPSICRKGLIIWVILLMDMTMFSDHRSQGGSVTTTPIQYEKGLIIWVWLLMDRTTFQAPIFKSRRSGVLKVHWCKMALADPRWLKQTWASRIHSEPAGSARPLTWDCSPLENFCGSMQEMAGSCMDSPWFTRSS